MSSELRFFGRDGALIAAIPLLAAILTSVFPLMEMVVEKDSFSYIAGEAYRGVTYPLFLDFFELFPNSLRLTVIAQTWIFTGAAIYLAWAFYLASGSRGLAVFLSALLALSPTSYFFNNAIFTESLFQSSLCFVLGALTHACVRRDGSAFVTFGLAIGLMILARPVGYAAIPVMIATALAVWLVGRYQPWRGLAVGFALIVACLIAERAVYYAVHGPERESVLGNALFAKTGMLSAGESPYAADDPRTAVWNFLEHDEAGAARAAVAQAPWDNLAFFMMHSYEGEMFFEYKADDLVALAAEAGVPHRALMAEVGGERMSRDLAGFLTLAVRHYIGHWQPFYYAVDQQEIDAYVAANSPLPMDNAGQRLTRDVVTPPSPELIHLAMAVGALASVALLAVSAALVWRDWPGWTMLTIAGLSVLTLHGQLMFTSIFSISSVRYLAVLWPTTALALCAAVAVVLALGFFKRPRSIVGAVGSSGRMS